MGGDYTRVSFDPLKGFSGVHKQQGRVSLDFEHNEFEQILDRRDRAEMYDTVGQAMVPATTPTGFKIGVSGTKLTIGIGRAYVDGILAECFGDIASPLTTVRDDVLGGVNGSGPVLYDAQPFFYSTPPFPALSTAAGTIDLVYLDVWQREVTVFEDPALREIALNGPDTATRVQTAWQVKILQNVPPGTTCPIPPPGWAALTAPSTARLTAQATPVAPAPGPCVINPAGGYTGIENRAYRVEVQTAGTLGGATPATFKWSRDNASLAARVLSIVAVGPTQSLITVGSTGRDAWMRFGPGDNIELIDDFVEWSMRETGTGGQMATIVNVNHAAGEILISKNLSAFPVVPGQHPRIRRWDIAKPGDAAVRPVNNGTAIPLEEGISVIFGSAAGDTLHAGDYIVFAARTADGSIEAVVNAPPRGILHHYARLALVTAGAIPTVVNCFPPPPPVTTKAEGCCTVVVKPGDDIQAAIDSLPPSGGCVCLKVGTHPIGGPLKITAPNIVLHGESTGARIVSTSRAVLIVDSTGDVEVHDIWFETSGGPPDPDPDLDTLLRVTNCVAVAVYDCVFSTLASMVVTAVTIFDSNTVRVERNFTDGVSTGVRTIDDCQLITVRDNRLNGVADDSQDLSLIGVSMPAVDGPCEISGNRIAGFLEGIRLTQHAGNKGGSLVANNGVSRRLPSGGGKDPLWGIDVGGVGCTVRDNFVGILADPHAGIHARAMQVQITGNIVDSRSTAANAIGILLEGERRPGESPFDGGGVISANSLSGRLWGITAANCRGVEIDSNKVGKNGAGTPETGIGVQDSFQVLATGNLVADCVSGIFMFEGGEHRITENQINGGGAGIMLQAGTDAIVADNIVEGAEGAGIVIARNTETATVRGNHLIRCAIGEQAQAAILASECLGEIVVELNDVLETGARDGKLGVEVDGIRILGAARSRVQGNHVTYTTPRNLPRNLECRALRLHGRKTNSVLGGTPNTWALVLDNSFVGVGLQALVEILGDERTLERVTFSDNYCEHYNANNNDRNATVAIRAQLIVVQGNQIKAEPKFPAFIFFKIGAATFVGNVSSAIIQPPPVLLPTAVTSFNIVLP